MALLWPSQGQSLMLVFVCILPEISFKQVALKWIDNLFPLLWPNGSIVCNSYCNVPFLLSHSVWACKDCFILAAWEVYHVCFCNSCGIFFVPSPLVDTFAIVNRVASNSLMSFHVHEHIFVDNLLAMKFLGISVEFFFCGMDRYCQITFHGGLYSHQEPVSAPVPPDPRLQCYYPAFWSFSIWSWEEELHLTGAFLNAKFDKCWLMDASHHNDQDRDHIHHPQEFPPPPL